MNGDEQGQFPNRIKGEECAPKIVHLDADCCREILTLQQEVTGRIGRPGSYFELSEVEIREILDGGGLAVGVRVAEKLVAFCFALFPGERSDNLGRDFEMVEAEIAQVAHLEAAVVHPDFRGNGFAKKLAGLLVAEIREARRWRYVMNTVSPFNIPSLKTTLALGLVIRKLKVKYNDVLRYIFCLDLAKPIRIDAQSVVRVAASEISGQQELLENGYCGFGLETGKDGAIILYGKEAL